VAELVSHPLSRLRLGDGARVRRQGEQLSAEVNGATELTLDDAPAAALLAALDASGDTAMAVTDDTPETVSAAQRLLALGILSLEFLAHPGGEVVARLASTGYGLALREGPPALPWRPHPRCALWPDATGWQLSQPLSPYRLWLAGTGLLDLMRGRPTPWSDGPGGDELAAVLVHAAWAGGLTAVTDGAEAAPAWSDEELLFHTASRRRADHRLRGARQVAPAWAEPARAPARGAPLEPDLRRRLAAQSFESVLAGRHSSRGAALPIGLQDLRSLLRIVQAERGDGDQTRRAYPTAGGLLALEFHVVCGEVEGAAPGVYRFDGTSGELVELGNQPGCAEQVLAESAPSWGPEQGLPRALLVISARLPDLAARYQATAYRLALLEAGGALLLAAQAAAVLNLAACVLGTGNSELFAQACGRSEWDCPALAELAIGGRLDVPQR
jgi:SagB-type dehydrogenase family enzyme